MILLFLVQSPVTCILYCKYAILCIVELILAYGYIAFLVFFFFLKLIIFLYKALCAAIIKFFQNSLSQNFKAPVNTLLCTMCSNPSDDHQFCIFPCTLHPPAPLCTLSSRCQRFPFAFLLAWISYFQGPMSSPFLVYPLLAKHLLLKLLEREWKGSLFTAKNPTSHF